MSLSASLALACSRPGGPGISDEFGDASVAFVSGIKCLPVLSAEPLPPRSVVTNPGTGTGDDNVVLTGDLFAAVGRNCSACHGDGQNGFSSKARDQDWSKVLGRIESDDPSSPGGFMPPASWGGKPWTSRRAIPNDPIVALAGLLELWVLQGKPAGQFYLSPPNGADGGVPDGAVPSDTSGSGPPPGTSQADYSMTPEVGARLTNIGSCVPNKYAVGINAQTMDGLDALFAAATELPDTLAETDLTTFDSDTLSRNGVISFVPAFPLWSDSAGKMRHVRTPHNQPIVFDKSSQQFQIPPNTRFYKTFFKKIIDVDGAEAYKKIETRLIISRPDVTLPDGTIQQRALYGTYLWDEGETNAVLLKDLLHDGKPFADRLLTYVTDEPRAQAIRAATPPTDNLEYALDTASPPVRRHYGVPGSERCVQCHMGSPSASFVLGFTPLQVATVPPGRSGVVEAATGDELTQLQRLIDYKVISGMTSPADVVPLERTQLPRTPRNDYELQAQAYMVGNCAHCHNPRGFPTTKAPELKGVLDFLPSPDGGIFQFPLDRTSPVRARGANHSIPIPYITPSLRDLPTQGSSAFHVKYRDCPGDGEIGTDGWCTTASNNPYRDFIDAPWRSLIYRNVDTPFDYVDDLTIFPHMPMNTPGYDCRVARIMGDWMVSIPSAFVVPNAKQSDIDGDATPQPYLEVKPGDSAYSKAQSDAKKRLDSYHAGHRYGFCPDSSDVVDPDVSSGARQTPADLPIYDSSVSPERMVMIADGVPNRANWVVTDATDPPGDWLPRGIGWEGALVDHLADASGSGTTLANLQTVVDDLRDVTLDDRVRSTLLTEVPFGIWGGDLFVRDRRPDCDFSGVPTAGSYQGAARPYWIDANNVASAAPSAPVYLQSPAGAVFTNICYNCHGPQADAKGLLADEISIMTGGDARVANFRTGLFGPESAPGLNRMRVFSPNPADPHAPLPGTGTPDDYGARYLAWMALGGTKKTLPPDLLQIVSITPVVGQIRSGITSRASANMLQLAQELCSNVLLSSPNTTARSFANPALGWMQSTALITKNGDAEMWLKVCSLNNRPVVRVLLPQIQTQSAAGTTQAMVIGLNMDPLSLYWGDAVDANKSPVFANAQVLDHRGNLATGIGPDNLVPLCVKDPNDDGLHAAEHAATDVYLRSRPITGDAGSSVIPYCPKGLFATDAAGKLRWHLDASVDPTTNSLIYPDATKWALRGAINAGLAVFLYVDQMSKGLLAPSPLYNQCELLNRGPSR